MSWLDRFNDGIDHGVKNFSESADIAIRTTIRALAKLFATILASLAVAAVLAAGIPFIAYAKHYKPSSDAPGPFISVAIIIFALVVAMTVARAVWDWAIPGTGDMINKWRYLLPGLYAVLLLVLYVSMP